MSERVDILQKVFLKCQRRFSKEYHNCKLSYGGCKLLRTQGGFKNTHGISEIEISTIYLIREPRPSAHIENLSVPEPISSYIVPLASVDFLWSI